MSLLIKVLYFTFKKSKFILKLGKTFFGSFSELIPSILIFEELVSLGVLLVFVRIFSLEFVSVFSLFSI